MVAITCPVEFSEPGEAMLRRLAAALDCPVESFVRPNSSELGQTAELLGLWMGLARKEDRAKVLAYIRA